MSTAISWFEDMYQKLEANAVPIYEGSIKFVEDQVETVGVCVENLCADFVQNALPVLSDDLLGSESPRLQPVDCADNGTVDKSELGMSSDSVVASELDATWMDWVNTCNEDGDCTDEEGELFTEMDECHGVVECAASTEVLNSCNEDNSEDQILDSTDEEGKLCAEMDECHEVVEGVTSTDDQSLPSPKSALQGTTPTDADSSAEDGKLCADMDECAASTSTPTVGDEVWNGMSYEQVRYEIEQKLDEVKLNESCVLVDKHEHLSVSQLDGKKPSYKKKIRNMFYPRRWSSKNQEQLSTWNEDTDTFSDQECRETLAAASTLESSNTNLESNSLESDWEIV